LGGAKEVPAPTGESKEYLKGAAFFIENGISFYKNKESMQS